MGTTKGLPCSGFSVHAIVTKTFSIMGTTQDLVVVFQFLQQPLRRSESCVQYGTWYLEHSYLSNPQSHSFSSLNDKPVLILPFPAHSHDPAPIRGYWHYHYWHLVVSIHNVGTKAKWMLCSMSGLFSATVIFTVHARQYVQVWGSDCTG